MLYYQKVSQWITDREISLYHLSVSSSICILSIYPSVHRIICALFIQSVHILISPCIHTFLISHPSMNLSIHPDIHTYVHTAIHPSIMSSIRPSINLHEINFNTSYMFNIKLCKNVFLEILYIKWKLMTVFFLFQYFFVQLVIFLLLIVGAVLAISFKGEVSLLNFYVYFNI